MEVLKITERANGSSKIIVMLSRAGNEYIVSIMDVFRGFIGERFEMYFKNEIDALSAFDNVLLIVESTNSIYEVIKTIDAW